LAAWACVGPARASTSLTVTTATLDNAIVGHAYRTSLAATGGTQPYHWSLVSGSLDGLSLSTSGVITGRANATGTYPITVRVTDSSAPALTATRTLNLTAIPLTRWLLGYYVGYEETEMPVSEIDWSALTHIVVGPVVPNADGSLNTSLDLDPTNGSLLGKSIPPVAIRNGVVPMLMIGGAGAHDPFLTAASQHRATLVTNLVNLMKSWGYLGLDIDFEPVNTSDEPAVQALISALRAALPKATLTMPVYDVNANFPGVPSFYGTVSAQLNRVDIMTYGMYWTADGWQSWHSSALHGATPTTPTAVDVSVQAYEKTGVPAAKLGVGMGFYGQCWRPTVTGPLQNIGTSTVVADDSTMPYTSIMTSYYSAAAYRYSSIAQAPYLSSASGVGPDKCTFLSYENAQSIAAKGAWAKAQGLGAEIVWTINQGHFHGAAAPDALLKGALRNFSL
jgi:chitinase